MWFGLYPTWHYARVDYLRAILRDDPATTFTIGWVQHSGELPVVYYGMRDRGLDASAYTYTAYSSHVVSAQGMQHHFVRLTNLAPDTDYFFVIKDSEGLSRRYWFHTLSNKPERRLSLVALGALGGRQLRQQAHQAVAKLRPDAVLFSGTITNQDAPSEWEAWLADWQLTIPRDGRLTPIIPARGDYALSPESLRILFDIPRVAGYYALSLGGALLRLYTLNTLVKVHGAQQDWLERDLRQHTQSYWKLAQYHDPIRPLQSIWDVDDIEHMPWSFLFDRYGVKCVLEGGSGHATTTWPVRPSEAPKSELGFIRANQATTYLGVGTWQATTQALPHTPSWLRAQHPSACLTWLWIDKESIEVRRLSLKNIAHVGALTDNNRFRLPLHGQLISSTKNETHLRIQQAATARTPSNTRIDVLGYKLVRVRGLPQLQWTVTHNVRKIQFEVQRSVNGVYYETMSEFTCRGPTMDMRSFIWHERESVPRHTLYRLKVYLPNGQREVYRDLVWPF